MWQRIRLQMNVNLFSLYLWILNIYYLQSASIIDLQQFPSQYRRPPMSNIFLNFYLVFVWDFFLLMIFLVDARVYFAPVCLLFLQANIVTSVLARHSGLASSGSHRLPNDYILGDFYTEYLRYARPEFSDLNRSRSIYVGTSDSLLFPLFFVISFYSS